MEVLNRLHRTYDYVVNDLSDPRSKDWLPVSTPLFMFGPLLLYLKFANDWGPRLMKNRKPLELKYVLIAYNASQIFINVYLICRALLFVQNHGYDWRCEPMRYEDTPRELEMVVLTRYFFLLKTYDLLDTVFHVLRKKNGHVNFLHVYHHAGMFYVTWAGVKFIPGGHFFFLAFQNAIVHTVMYTYFLLTSINPEFKKNIGWKKHLTQLQMVQFLLNTIHLSLPLVWTDCDYPKIGLYVMVPQNLFMTVLFADFYKKAYMNKKKKES